jgi:CubicO group peptidase (beta-lactamase class C family)
MRRRDLLGIFAGTIGGIGSALRTNVAVANDIWGAAHNYPSGWGPPGEVPKWEAYPEYRVGNFSGGFERMFGHRKIAAGPTGTQFKVSPEEIKYRWRGSTKTVADYLVSWPVTAMLIARNGRIFHEAYLMGRRPNMRFQSWSMAKSVTSILVGAALDRRLIGSLDDVPQDYVESLRGTLHGQIPMRHLLNMSSGADVDHDRDTGKIDVPCILGLPSARTIGTDLERVVHEWRGMHEPPGQRYNYNELCALTMGMVLRSVSKTSLSEFAQERLWKPLGAQTDAMWLTDSLGREYNCVGFAATLRDWARLAQMIAQRGQIDGRRVVSEKWIENCATHGPQDRQVAFGSMRPDMGYKNFFWHPKPAGKWLMMNGAHGQRVLIDRATETILVQLAVSQEGQWQSELFNLFEAATTI